MTDRAGWDFFVSYTQADRAWAEWIAWVLQEDGYRVLVQAWDFVPGTNWVQGMQLGAARADRTVAVLSKEYLDSVYGGAEWQAAWAADPDGGRRKVLPVRIADCERPGLLAGVVGIDLFGVGEAEARARVHRMAAETIAGTGRPAVQPPFPPQARSALSREARFPGTLPRVWNVPARNPNFTGREASLTAMRRGLAAAATVTVQAVRGLGGVGKTQLANEYAYRYAADYDLVWWIAAEEPTLLPEQFAALVSRLGGEPDQDRAVLLGQVQDALRQVPGWLLVFDNADAAADIRPWLPAVPLPPGVPGHVVVTTRRGGFAAIGRVQDLDVVDEAEALQLMRSRVPGLADEDGRRIAEELGRLPLALEQAAAFLDSTGMPPAEYLDVLTSRALELYGRGAVASRADTVATLWTLSLDRVAAQSPAALQLLEICAYLAPVPIPLDLFTGNPDALPEPLATAAPDPLTFTEAIAAAVDYSLVKRTPEGLQLHRLVQGAIRLRVAPDGHEPGIRALRLLRADLPESVVRAPEHWPRWTTLLPHVLSATGWFDDTAAGGDDGGGPECALLLDQAAFYLHAHARHDDVLPLAERALRIAEGAYGPDHAEVAARLNNLAVLLWELGRPLTARPLAERAVRIIEMTREPDDPSIGATLTTLAVILRLLGEPAAARPLVERTLSIDESIFGPDHPEVATDLINLSEILVDLGERAAARSLVERALRINEAVLGADHPNVGTALNNLAMILKDLGDPAAARPLAERAVRIDEKIYGPDHPEVGTDLSSLSSILWALGDRVEARRHAERSVRITEQAFGSDHPTLGSRLRNLAMMLLEIGEPVAAAALLERAEAISRAPASEF